MWAGRSQPRRRCGKGEPSHGPDVGFYQAGSEPRLHERGSRRRLAMALRQRHEGCYEGDEERSRRVRLAQHLARPNAEHVDRSNETGIAGRCGDGPKSTMRFECFISRRKWLAHLCGRAGACAGGRALEVRVQTSGAHVFGCVRVRAHGTRFGPDDEEVLGYRCNARTAHTRGGLGRRQAERPNNANRKQTTKAV
jgi:hypothetical protein